MHVVKLGNVLAFAHVMLWLTRGENYKATRLCYLLLLSEEESFTSCRYVKEKIITSALWPVYLPAIVGKDVPRA